MKTVQVNIDYTDEINSPNKEWINREDRNCDIIVRDDNHRLIKYSGYLTTKQIEHIIFLIQENFSELDIKTFIKDYEDQNFSLLKEPILGDI